MNGKFLNAMEKVVFSGRVLDWNNNLKKLNGQLVVSFFDKPMNNATLGQNISSPKINFKTQEKNLFKGMVTVKRAYLKFHLYYLKTLVLILGKGRFLFTLTIIILMQVVKNLTFT